MFTFVWDSDFLPFNDDGYLYVFNFILAFLTQCNNLFYRSPWVENNCVVKFVFVELNL